MSPERLLAIAATLACGGCAVLSNVTPIGDGAFMTVVRSNDVNGRVEGEVARAMSQATSYCHERGLAIDVIRTVPSPPPPGQAPSAEIDFRCKAT